MRPSAARRTRCCRKRRRDKRKTSATARPRTCSRHGVARACCAARASPRGMCWRRTSRSRPANGAPGAACSSPPRPKATSRGAFARTSAGPKADRLALLRATATNIESIFLLAPDRDRALANALAAVAQSKPDATAELNGVGIRLWVVRDVSRIPLLAAPLYIADGHHRYETASAYALENRAADRVLALVVSAQDPGLAVLPTHRVIFGAGRDLDRLLPRWRGWFDIQAVPAGGDPVAHLASIGRDRTACLVADRSRTLALLLRPDALPDRLPMLAQSDAVRELDVARVESFVVKEILGTGTSTPIVRYVADAKEALELVQHGGAALAVLLNPTRVEQVFAVADAADVMPPKSTYFIPKVPSGLVLRSVS